MQRVHYGDPQQRSRVSSEAGLRHEAPYDRVG
jgi:hypothetical protein